MIRNKTFLITTTLSASILFSSIAYSSSNSRNKNTNILYTVKEGENLFQIAEKFNNNIKTENLVAEIQVLNNVNEVIYPGEKIIIPVKK